MENIDEILDAPQVEVTRLQYAGFWIRTGAYLIDAIILGVAGFIAGSVMAAMVDGILVQIFNLVIGVLYFALMEGSSYQGTLGKMAVGIRVGDQRGEQISAGNAIGRYFAKILSAILLCIGFLMVAWDDKSQGLHDKLANTYVFYTR
jgi:uncharacterized RDD family membrane protein YckC